MSIPKFPQHNGRGLLSSSEGNRILGFFKTGGPPTVLVTEGNAFLTALHEQTHFDDITNTLWGFILRCEGDLAQLEGQSSFFRWKHRRCYMSMISRGWDVLEGSAVCSEVLFLYSLGRKKSVLDLFSSIPRSYRNAATPFIGTLMDGLILPAKLDLTDRQCFFFVSAYRAAIAELSLDLQLISKARAGTSYSDALSIARFTRPSKNMRNILQALPSIDWQQFGDDILEAEQNMNELVHPGTEISRTLRLHIVTIKKVLAREVLDSNHVTVSDLLRTQISSGIRRELEDTFAQLRRLRYRPNAPVMRVTDVTGGNKLGNTMQEIEVTPEEFNHLFTSDDDFLTMLPESERNHFTCRLIFTIPLPGAGPDKHFGGELNFSEPQDDFSVARYGNLIRFSYIDRMIRDQLSANRARPLPTLGWLGFGIVDHDGLIDDWQYWSSRPDPVFLWSPVFSDQSIVALKNNFGEAAKLYAGPVPGPLNLTLLRCEIKQVTIFWLDSGPVPLEVIETNGALAISEEVSMEFTHPPKDNRFLAAYVASLHIMPNMLKGLGVDLTP